MNDFSVLIASTSRDLSKFEGLSRTENFKIGGTVALTGIVVVFAVLAIIWGILALLKLFTYDIPNKKKSNSINSTSKSNDTKISLTEQISDSSNNNEIVAAITAAISVILSSENTNNRSKGFRVVSFRRK